MLKRLISVFLILGTLTAFFTGCTASRQEPTSVTTPPLETTLPKPATIETEAIAPSTEAPTEPATEPPATQVPETEPEAPVTLPAFCLSEQSVVLTEKGQILDLYCGEVPRSEISWLSADESIALFSQGKVVAINKGTTVVYAKYDGRIIFCEVICDVDPDAQRPYIPNELLQAPRLAPPVVDMEDTTFFDDAAFIGDSVSYVLQQWHYLNGAFGNATFLTRSSMGLQNSIDGRIKISYQGSQYSPEDALALVDVNKVFVMLGFNDVALWGIDGCLERWDIFLGRILEKCPDIQIYIQSCTPIHANGAYPGYDNDLFDDYNAALENYCQEKGYHFVNIAPYFKNYNNSMVTKYSSDKFVHITYDGALVWERVLKAYGAEQLALEAAEEGEK